QSRSSGRARGKARAGAWRPQWYSWCAPRKPDRRGGHGGETLTPAGEAELFAGGRLDADPVDRDAGDLGGARPHRVAMRAELGGLAHDGEVEMHDAAAARPHALDREPEEAVR